MKKYIKKHLKDEKRILKLIYRKGFFHKINISLDALSWQDSFEGKTVKTKPNKLILNNKDCLPILCVCNENFGGDVQYMGVVNSFKEYLFWETAKDFDLESGYPVNQKYPSTNALIKFLSSLPDKVNNSKFKKHLLVKLH